MGGDGIFRDLGMGKGTSKRRLATVLLIAILAVSSIVMVESVSGSTKPSTPEFTLKIVDSSYDIAPYYFTRIRIQGRVGL